MTILNGVTQGTKAFICTDTAWTGPDGEVVALASKFIIGSAFPFVIAFTGNLNPYSLNEEIQKAGPRNARQLIERLPAMLQELVASAEDIPLDAGLMCAIWDKRRGRPMIYLIASSDRHWPGAVEPFKPLWIEEVVGGELAPAEALGRQVTLSDPRSFDPLKDSAKLVEAQRRHHRFEHYGKPAVRIGGGVEVAELGRRGAKIHRVCEWPDKIGERIRLPAA